MADLLPPIPTEQVDEKVHDSKRPFQLVPYEEFGTEAFKSLEMDNFRGLQVDYTATFFDDKFYISSTMGPKADYEFGAYYFDPMVRTNGTLDAKAKAVLTDKIFVKAYAERTNESPLWKSLEVDYMALNYRGQFQLGTNGRIGGSYVQVNLRLTPRLSLGGKFFWESVTRDSAVGYAARYETDKMVASAKVVSTGEVLVTYVHKISKNVLLASDFMYNCFSRYVEASVGYDCKFKQFYLQGKIDSNGVASILFEKKVSMGLKYLLSATLDHNNKDYRLGLGLTYEKNY